VNGCMPFLLNQPRILIVSRCMAAFHVSMSWCGVVNEKEMQVVLLACPPCCSRPIPMLHTSTPLAKKIHAGVGFVMFL